MRRWLLILSLFICYSLMGDVPRVSVIVSVYKGEEYIDGFLADLERESIFDQCEFIFINANSPENEEEHITAFCERYPNIIYRKLDSVVSIYKAWNIAIELAHSPYIMNANLDDRLSPDCLEVLANALDEHPDVDLVYSDYFETAFANETFENNRHHHIHKPGKFSLKLMGSCFPGIHPMWRKSMHEKYGMFDDWYRALGDYEMWLRAVSGGAKFHYVPVNTGLCFVNHTGISRCKELSKSRIMERKILHQKWGHIIQYGKRSQRKH